MLDWIQATQGMKITSRFLSNSNRLRAEILKAYTVPNVVFRNLASRNKKYIVQHLYYTVYLKPKTDGKFFHILNLHCTVQYNIYIFFFFGSTNFGFGVKTLVSRISVFHETSLFMLRNKKPNAIVCLILLSQNGLLEKRLVLIS